MIATAMQPACWGSSPAPHGLAPISKRLLRTHRPLNTMQRGAVAFQGTMRAIGQAADQGLEDMLLPVSRMLHFN
eukprot:s401_g6.t1